MTVAATVPTTLRPSTAFDESQGTAVVPQLFDSAEDSAVNRAEGGREICVAQ
jgi:hypothetical protein